MQRRYRLCRKADFVRLRRHGRRFSHPLAVVVVCEHDASAGVVLPHSRFAFSASKRVGNAVQRNRAKRLLREAVRLHMAQLRANWDCLFIARSQTATASFAEVETAVLQLLRRAKLLEQ